MRSSHTLIILFQDEPGAFQRIINLLRRRDFPLRSLSVGPSERNRCSRMTVSVEASNAAQVAAQLTRLLEVVEVSDVTNVQLVERETVLARVAAQPADRPSLVNLIERFGARIVDVGPQSLIIELCAAPSKVEYFLEALLPFGLSEVQRAGRLVMPRTPSLLEERSLLDLDRVAPSPIAAH